MILSSWPRALIVAGGLLSAGCFSYVPAELGTVSEGDDVRVHLTRQGLADLPEPPAEAGLVLTGRFVGGDDERLLLQIPLSIRSEALAATSPVRQKITIPVRGIDHFERRAFSRVRTGIAIASGAAAALAIFLGFGAEDDGNSPTPPVPPIESTRVPLPLSRGR